MDDTLSIKGMHFHAFHGVDDYEKKHGNDFEVDVILHADLTAESLSDDINSALNYTRVHELTAEVMNGDSVNLIEKLAYRIGQHIWNEFTRIDKLDVKVRKLNPPVHQKTKFTEASLSWPR